MSTLLKWLSVVVGATCICSCGISKKQQALIDNKDKGFNVYPLSDPRFDAALDTTNLYISSKWKDQTAFTEEDLLAVAAQHDTIASGQIVMKNVVDEETGEEMIVDRLAPSVIISRFARRQERGGKVPVDFQLCIPHYMVARNWEVQLKPEITLLCSSAIDNIRDVIDSTQMDVVCVDGPAYNARKNAQLRRYNSYEESISRDSLHFVKHHLLNTFLTRNGEKNKSDVDKEMATDHYSNDFIKANNLRKVNKREKVYKRIVTLPIPQSEIKLDTVFVSGDSLLLNYSAEITTKGRPTLNKALIYVSGDIYEGIKHIYTLNRKKPLEYMISSVVDFVKDTVMYKVIMVPTHLQANSEYNIIFERGKDKVVASLADNATQISEIKSKIRQLIKDDKYILDSILVTATASPEGSLSRNAILSKKRSASISNFFVPFISHCRDSLAHAYRDSLAKVETGVLVELDFDADGNLVEKGKTEETKVMRQIPKISFIPHSLAENWEKLDLLFLASEEFTPEEKSLFNERMKIADPDRREAAMKKDSYYKKMVDELYPQLRVVKMDFLLRLSETVDRCVVTDEVDERYTEALEALHDRDWETGVKILQNTYPDDYNLGVAYLMLDRNFNASHILEKQKRTPNVNYMLALAYLRIGEEGKALEAFKASCKGDKSKFIRGNKDPEILYLKNKYNLTIDMFEDTAAAQEEAIQ